MNDVDFSILLCLTPDDFTCQGESPRLGKSYFVVKTISLTLSCLYHSYMNDVDFSILLCLTPDDFTCQWESPWMGKNYLVVKTISLTLSCLY